jgi:hypothetical protein
MFACSQHHAHDSPVLAETTLTFCKVVNCEEAPEPLWEEVTAPRLTECRGGCLGADRKACPTQAKPASSRSLIPAWVGGRGRDQHESLRLTQPEIP